MKYSICVVFLAVVACSQALTPEQIEKIKEHREVCSKETSVDLSLVAKLKNGEFTDDAKLKAYLFCFSKRVGFQNEAGEIQADVIRTKVNGELKDEAKTDEYIKECAVQKATPEDTAFDAVKCVLEKSNKKITLF